MTIHGDLNYVNVEIVITVALTDERYYTLIYLIEITDLIYWDIELIIIVALLINNIDITQLTFNEQ